VTPGAAATLVARALAALLVAGCTVPPGATGSPEPVRTPSPTQTSNPRTRLFAPQNLGLLEAPDRDQWQRPDQIMDSLRIADGSVVADLGAGGGWFTARLSARVGPNGIVYAEDIQPGMIDIIERRKVRENLRNVRTVLGTPNDPRLPRGIDAALIVDVFREMQIPPADPVMLLRRVAASLKADGRIGVVDFNPSGGGPGPDPEDRVDPQAIIDTANAAGLRLIAREPANPFQFLLIFGKAAVPAGAAR
jgi:ubiquinone/menaquinone biosynthesis C-methylase UbiE